MRELSPKLRSWASILEPEAEAQAFRTSKLEVVDHVALMPDAHFGMGATVGSVIATENAIIPAAVGVDIGCGMIATQLSMRADQLPTNLEAFLPHVAAAVPAGVGKGHEQQSRAAQKIWAEQLAPVASFKDQKLIETAYRQLGSLGSGNHFFEICLDRNDVVWMVLHSGSRGIGNKLAQVHIRGAKKLARDLHRRLEDPDLAYFMDSDPEFNAYIGDMLWAQEYARHSREIMMNNVLKAFTEFCSIFMDIELGRINCHHNFTEPETHNGRLMWITRKGAIKADEGDYGVIPGSMGARSFIVRGLGNELSFNSCSHGAGRTLSRTKAKKLFTAEDLADRMGDRAWQHEDAEQLIDEIPDAYKDIDVVMEDQKDLVVIEAELRQVLNYKGC
jgi:tRNA-splicing ligase RtcB